MHSLYQHIYIFMPCIHFIVNVLRQVTASVAMARIVEHVRLCRRCQHPTFYALKMIVLGVKQRHVVVVIGDQVHECLLGIPHHHIKLGRWGGLGGREVGWWGGRHGGRGRIGHGGSVASVVAIHQWEVDGRGYDTPITEITGRGLLYV